MSPSPRALRPDQWPAGDRLAWKVASSPAGPLDDPGSAAHWRPATRHTVEVHYGLWLRWLVETDRLCLDMPPVARASRDNLSAYLIHLRDRDLSPVTVTNQFRDLREALRVMQPHADFSQLTRLLMRLNAVADTSRDDARPVVSPVLPLDAALREMVRLQAEHSHDATRRTAERFRDALMIAFLASRPIRLQNFTDLTLGSSFVMDDGTYRCRFSAREMKDHNPLEFPMPKALVPWLAVYLNIYRPMLLRGVARDRLWISLRSTDMEANSIYYRVRHVTQRLVAVALNPHRFRHCVATFIAEVAPAEVKIVARILGHSTLETSEKFYNLAGMLTAQQRYLEAIDRLRRPDNRSVL